MKRSLLVVLDSVGIGHAPDAADYGDEGSDTLGHIYARVPDLELPHLDSIGLAAARAGAAGACDPLPPSSGPAGTFGWMIEASAGKDTTSGHWELAGCRVRQPFDTFTEFPREILEPLEDQSGVSFLGNYAESGTVVLETLGADHLKTGSPILYTSADSVLQIAAHEEVIAADRLHDLCRAARAVCDSSGFQVGRVIARPFLGNPGSFQRTANRRDFSLTPPRSVLDALSAANVPVTGIGKISDIFAGQGIATSFPTKSNAAGLEKIDQIWSDPTASAGLVFVNLVDFDTQYGHRRDPEGYAQCLREFDTWLGHFLPQIGSEDLVMITADHGNDPTWHGTDHTREKVPLLIPGPLLCDKNVAERGSFADVGASIAQFHGLLPWPHGTSFLA